MVSFQNLFGNTYIYSVITKSTPMIDIFQCQYVCSFLFTDAILFYLYSFISIKN